MRLLFKNIKELVQVRREPVRLVSGDDMGILPTIKNAYLLVEGEHILDFGSMVNCPDISADKVVDASGRMILPAWCDSHTHMVYAGHREEEFVHRIKGMSYKQIAERGGGILNSAKTLQNTPEEELYAQSKLRMEEMIASGTGAVEIKSGYGLTVEAELKMLRVIKQLGEHYPIDVKSTFLPTHALPEAYKNNRQSFIQSMLEEALPVVAEEQLAEYIDVFCETGYFTAQETDLILSHAAQYGLIPKIHVNQFTAIGGIQVGVKHQALSVDHLEVITDEDIDSLSGTETMPVALPGCSYFLGIPYTPARTIIDARLPLALATDYNPGSAPSGNMNFVVSAACIKMKMTPEEAINAATVNGAYAMGLSDRLGSITVGKKACLLLTKPISSYAALPYAFASGQIDEVYIAGKKWKDRPCACE